MADAKPSIENILCCDKLPIVLVKSYQMEAFVMGYHVYKKTWKPFVGEKLDTAMEPNNVMDKNAVAILLVKKSSSISLKKCFPSCCNTERF